MIQHIAILLIIPPLLLTGTDSKYLEKLIKRPGFKKVGKILFLPLVAWMLGVGSMWVWHIPGLYVAMKESMPLMTLNIITMLVFGIIFIWPVFAPVRFMKLDALQTALFLFTACVGCTVLGIYITFMPDSLYTSVLTGHNEIIMSLVKNSWGISPVIDQQMGGLIMWVPACFIYVTNILIGLSKWFRAPETENTNEKSLGVDIK
jgi:putative membrane protein